MYFLLWSLLGWGAYEGWKWWKTPKPLTIPSPLPPVMQIVPWMGNMGTTGVALGGTLSLFPPGGPAKASLSVINATGMLPKAVTNFQSGQQDFSATTVGTFPVTVSWIETSGGKTQQASFKITVA